MTSRAMAIPAPCRIAAALLAALTILAFGRYCAAAEIAGVVHSCDGKARITRGDTSLPVAPGTKLFVGDVLSTGPDATVGVVFRDDSTLSLGPESRLVLRTFLFSPADRELGLVARLTQGTMAYLSGLLGKLAPEKVRFETPVATIGIRGTRFAVRAGEPSRQ
ncbi:MAG: hypothetical protein Kow00128_17760 [Deltaproteobacteria bacterium]